MGALAAPTKLLSSYPMEDKRIPIAWDMHKFPAASSLRPKADKLPLPSRHTLPSPTRDCWTSSSVAHKPVELHRHNHDTELTDISRTLEGRGCSPPAATSSNPVSLAHDLPCFLLVSHAQRISRGEFFRCGEVVLKPTAQIWFPLPEWFRLRLRARCLLRHHPS